jgi:hypothetical protein
MVCGRRLDRTSKAYQSGRPALLPGTNHWSHSVYVRMPLTILENGNSDELLDAEIIEPESAFVLIQVVERKER